MVVRMLVVGALAALMLLSCSAAPLYSGVAYFVQQPFDNPDTTNYDTFVSNNQWKFYSRKPDYPNDTFLAYFNVTAIRIEDNALINLERSESRGWWLFDGADSVIDSRYGTIMTRFDDPELGVWYAEWIDRFNGDWDGIYLDQMFHEDGLDQTMLDSITAYTAYTEAQVRAQFAVLRDTLIVCLRDRIGDDKVIVANTGYPTYYHEDLNGVTIESGHADTPAKTAAIEAVLKQYVTYDNKPIRSISWDWSTFWADSGYIAP